MSTYAIGDIQGCFSELEALLEKIQFDQRRDTLWLLGDLVNRGPQNIETLDFLMSLPNVISVLGNHDLHFMAVAMGCHKPSRSDTLSDILESAHLPDIIEWLRNLPLAHLDPDLGYLMVHAGVPKIWSISESLHYANEVEQAIRGQDFEEFLSEMYGNQPANWSPKLQGMERLRVITNYLTRLRYCKANGEMDLIQKETKAPPGYKPWFNYYPPQLENDITILFGHWAALEGVTGRQNIIGLDTGCLWGRELTALRLEDRQMYSVPSQQILVDF
ncbi:MAG: bis(5'-nucleosyl)-tetraphosphatase (symmetrical) [Candidatus Azotimanducaceae bacterium]|jgi:bis(5'-nucleosyl)-tetraphosphatase (symmetrical)